MVRRGCGALLAVLVAAGLAGCTATSSAPTATTAATIPAFPKLDGRELEADSPVPGDWRVRIAAADVDVAYGRARTLLTEAGFVLTKDRAGGIGGDGQACTTDLCVDFTATEDSRFGPSVLYEVFHPSGIVG